MGRVRKDIDVQGRPCWTLFDTGARNTYVTPDVASLLVTSTTKQPLRTALGGAVRETNRWATLEANIEGHPILTQAFVLDDIGKDEDGKPIQVLFGALAMQQWGIHPVPEKEALDLTHYSREFVEF
jgi:hypothetical protein